MKAPHGITSRNFPIDPWLSTIGQQRSSSLIASTCRGGKQVTIWPDSAALQWLDSSVTSRATSLNSNSVRSTSSGSFKNLLNSCGHKSTQSHKKNKSKSKIHKKPTSMINRRTYDDMALPRMACLRRFPKLAMSPLVECFVIAHQKTR